MSVGVVGSESFVQSHVSLRVVLASACKIMDLTRVEMKDMVFIQEWLLVVPLTRELSSVMILRRWLTGRHEGYSE